MVSEHAVRSSSAAPRCSAAPGGRGHLNFGPMMEWDACAPWMGWEECCAAPLRAAACVGELKFSSSYEMRTRKLPSQLKPRSLGVSPADVHMLSLVPSPTVPGCLWDASLQDGHGEEEEMGIAPLSPSRHIPPAPLPPICDPAPLSSRERKKQRQETQPAARWLEM